eukprot:jgi/Botrbrau1/3146/Bobra.0070s0113.1
MWQALCATVLLSCSWSMACQQGQLVSNKNDSEYLQIFQKSWQKHKDLIHAGGQLTACFNGDELDRDGILMKPNEVAILLIARVTLYGAGLNSTVLPNLLFHYQNLFRVVFHERSRLLLMAAEVTAQSASLSSLSQDTCIATPTDSACLFDPRQYTTVTVHYDMGYTRTTKCWKNAVRKDRMLLVSVWNDAVRDMGFPDVHVMDFMAGYVHKPDIRNKYIAPVRLSFQQETINVTLEFFGPCAVSLWLREANALTPGATICFGEGHQYQHRHCEKDPITETEGTQLKSLQM